jgi:hypothetical protein
MRRFLITVGVIGAFVLLMLVVRPAAAQLCYGC